MMNNNLTPFFLYPLPNNEGEVSALIKDDTIWLTQKSMAHLFGVNLPAISKHLKNIFEEGEIEINSTVSKMEIVQNEGGERSREASTFITLTPLYRWATGLALRRRHASANGRRRC